MRSHRRGTSGCSSSNKRNKRRRPRRRAMLDSERSWKSWKRVMLVLAAHVHQISLLRWLPPRRHSRGREQVALLLRPRASPQQLARWPRGGWTRNEAPQRVALVVERRLVRHLRRR